MAAITANVGSNNWNTAGAWVGGVQPTAADDVTIPATAVVTIPTATTVLGRSLTVSALGTIVFASTTAVLTLGDATAGAGSVALSVSATATVTLTGIGVINFISTSATVQTVTSGGKTLPNITFNGVGSSYQFAGATTASLLTLTNGTLNTNSQTCSFSSISTATTNTRTLTLGSSAITITGGGTAFDIGTSGAQATALTVTANTATVTMTGAAAALRVGSGKNWNGMSLAMTGSGAALLTTSSGTNTFTNFSRIGTAVKTDSFLSQFTINVTGLLTLQGNSTVNRILVGNQTLGTVSTYNIVNTPTISNVDFQDVTGTGSSSPLTGTSIGDCGGLTNVTADTPATQTHTSSAGGNWSDPTKWTSRVPLPQDNVIIDVNTTGTHTWDMPRLGKDITLTGFAGTASWNIVGYTLYGSFALSSAMAMGGTGQALNLNGRSSHTITCAGKTIPLNVQLTAFGGTYTLADPYNCSNINSIPINNGVLDTGGFTMTTSVLASNSGFARGFNMNNSTINLFGTGGNPITITAAGMTLNSGTSNIVFTAVTATTQTLQLGGLTYYNLTRTTSGSTGGITLTGSNSFNDIFFSDASNARTFTLTSGTTTTIRATHGLTGFLGTSGKLMSMVAVTAGVPATIAFPNGYGGGSDFLSVKDITATTNTWYAGANSTNVSGNTNVTFSAPPGASGASNSLMMMSVG